MEAFEAFTGAATKACLEAGVTEREVREASGPIAETAAARATSAHKGGCLLLLGSPGTGKTLAATRWLISPLCNPANWNTSAADATKWSLRLRGSYVWRTAKSLSRVGQYDEAAVEKLFGATRLVIDDAGQEYLDKSGFLASLIDELVSERHRRELPTVVTGNLNAEEFEARYGKRVVDRIGECGRLEVCVGTSMRKAPASDRPIAALFTPATVTARIAALQEAAEKYEAALQARREEDERSWRDGLRQQAEQRAAKEAAKLAANPPMTADQVAERKAFLSGQLEEFRRGTKGAEA